jgi:hypothetical protein
MHMADLRAFSSAFPCKRRATNLRARELSPAPPRAREPSPALSAPLCEPPRTPKP